MVTPSPVQIIQVGVQGPPGPQGQPGPAGGAAASNGTWSAPNAIANNGVIGILANTAFQQNFVQGSGSAVTATVANPDAVGEQLVITGTSSVNTVALNNGGNLILNGNKVLAQGSVLRLIAVSLTQWVEAGYNGL